MEYGFTGLNSSRQSSVEQERMSIVASHMYEQYNDYQNANHIAKGILDSIYENMKVTTDYFRQTFSSRGISSDDIYCTKDEATQSLLLSILWHKIGFTMVFNDKPQVLENNVSRQRIICSRIVATKGDCIKVINENPDSMAEKIRNIEVASLYVPAKRSMPCELRTIHLINELHPISIASEDAHKEFLFRVIEYVCGGGYVHWQSMSL